jgi:hypothetical protein
MWWICMVEHLECKSTSFYHWQSIGSASVIPAGWLGHFDPNVRLDPLTTTHSTRMGSYTQVTMPIEATIASSNANGATPIVRPYSSLRAIYYGCDVLSRMCRGWSRERVVGISPIPSGSRSTVTSLVDRVKMPNELVQ